MLKYKILLIIGVLIGTAGQLFMKHGVNALGGLGVFPDKFSMLVGVFTSPYIIAGLFFTGIGMLMWITVISNLELSFAYPFMSISYIIILFFGWILFSEDVNALRIAGIAFIVCGVVVISRTGGAET